MAICNINEQCHNICDVRQRLYQRLITYIIGIWHTHKMSSWDSIKVCDFLPTRHSVQLFCKWLQRASTAKKIAILCGSQHSGGGGGVIYWDFLITLGQQFDTSASWEKRMWHITNCLFKNCLYKNCPWATKSEEWRVSGDGPQQP